MGKLKNKLASIIRASKGYKYFPHVIVATALVISFAVVTAVNPVKGLISTLSSGMADNPHLVGYWPLDSDAKDESGNNNHGTVSGAVFVYGGHDNEALYFDGNDDVLTTALEIDESSDSSGATFAAWVKTDLHPTWKPTEKSAIISTDEGGHAWSLMINKADWSYYNGTEEETPNIEAELYTWTHVTSVFDPNGNNGSGTSSFYVNGEKVHDGAIGYKNSSNTVRFGDSTLYDESFKGRIDEIYIYDVPLSDSQVFSLYSGNEVIPDGSPVNNPVDNNDNSIIIDSGVEEAVIPEDTADNKLIIDKDIE
ncbi:MAG: hypothetical protein GWP15_02020, partial [Nitrospirae bacterium]|nr:hypothetical protein [Nitrospirota bacterium]